MTESFPLHWPAGWPRTPTEDLNTGQKFRQRRDDGYGTNPVSFPVARDKLYDELKRLGAINPVVSTNHLTDRYGRPVESKRRVADEGVAVYFTLGDRQMVMACDKFEAAAANMRSLGLAIEALRQLERHGGGTMAERAFTGFVALPAPESPWETLGVKPGASSAEIEAAYRQKAKTAHPDQGGSHERMARLNAARAELLNRWDGKS
jgi:DnaJ domain